MSGLTEDVDVFQIDDFTVVSDWEVLVSELEDVLQNGVKVGRKCDESYEPVNEDEVRNGVWQTNKFEIKQRDFKASLSHFQLIVTRSKQDGQEEVTQGDERDESEQQQEQMDDAVVRFPVCYHDMSSSAFDFLRLNTHILVRCFGLREFLVLETADTEKRSSFAADESGLRKLLSCTRVALSTVDCTLPLFVRVAEQWRQLYEGVCVSRHFATQFEMAHLHRVPSTCGSLAGVLQLFRERLAAGGACGGAQTSGAGSDGADRLPPVLIAVRYHFVLTAPLSSFVQLAQKQLEAQAAPETFGVRFGTSSSVIEAIQLSALWPSLSELFAVDTEHYTELDPANAPNWIVEVRFRRLSQLIGSYCAALRSLLNFSNQYTGRAFKATEGEEIDVLPSATLDEMLAYLFADDKSAAEAESEAVPGDERETEFETEADSDASQDTRAWLSALAGRLKTAPRGDEGSIVHRLAFVVLKLAMKATAGRLEASLDDALRCVWRTFVLGLRSRFENDYLIPAVESGAPNTGYCLLYQKLQKLNCCILKRREQSLVALQRSSAHTRIIDVAGAGAGASDARASDSSSLAVCEQQQSSTSSDATKAANSAGDDDEFFECAETVEEASKMAMENTTTHVQPPEPEGRLHRCGERRLRRTNEPLFVPETQEAAPLTEDEVLEQQRVLASLGTDERSREVRARMQCAQLLSDMQAFRAANPAAEFEDFLAWHSPRDLVPVRRARDDECASNASVSGDSVAEADEASVEYELSERMRQPGNAWIDTWQRAQPLASARQKRLFDETNEAEKLLHWLERMPLDSLVDEQLVPALMHAALVRMAARDDPVLPRLRNSAAFLAEHVAQATAELVAVANDLEVSTAELTAAARAERSRVRRNKLMELIRKFEVIEIMITKRNELIQLFELAGASHSHADWTLGSSGNQSASATGADAEPVARDALESLVRDLLHYPDVALCPTTEPSHAALVRLLKRTVHTLRELTDMEHSDEGEFLFKDKPEAAAASVNRSHASPASRHKHPSNISLSALLGKPTSREMILRTVLARPNLSTSIPTPQRFYAYLSDEECRLAAAVTEDTIFT